MSKFISESAIAENKKHLQAAWDASRKENDPEHPPEEPPTIIDNRALYHRLEEQKLKKQEEYDDAHRLKNMVRGLEDEEIEFLDLVDRTKMEQERKVKQEENSALSEFRKRRVEMEIEQTSKLVSATVSVNTAKKQTPKNSQKALLSGAIRKKSDSSPPDKKMKLEDGSIVSLENGENPPTTIKTAADSSPQKPLDASGKNLICAGILPGLGHYSSSSDDSSNDSSDSEDHNHMVDITGREITRREDDGGCC